MQTPGLTKIATQPSPNTTPKKLGPIERPISHTSLEKPLSELLESHTPTPKASFTKLNETHLRSPAPANINNTSNRKSVTFADAKSLPLKQVKFIDEFHTTQTYKLKSNHGTKQYPPGPQGATAPSTKTTKVAHKNPPLPPRRDGRGHREAAAINYKHAHAMSAKAPMKVSQQLREVREKIPMQQQEYLTHGKILSNLGYNEHDSIANTERVGPIKTLLRFLKS